MILPLPADHMGTDSGTACITQRYIARFGYHCEWIDWVTEGTAEQWGEMGASRGSRSGQALAASREREPAAAVLDFAVARILWD